jgi:hypothetical protein
MKYQSSCIYLSIFSCLLFSSTTAAKQPLANSIGNIKDTTEIQGGGCSLTSKGKQEYVFWSTDSNFALMNIGGKDRTLQLVGKTVPSRREKKGDRSTSIYKTGKIIVRIDRVATRVCRVGDQECESTSYNGKIKLTVGDNQQTIAVEGGCGS